MPELRFDEVEKETLKRTWWPKERVAEELALLQLRPGKDFVRVWTEDRIVFGVFCENVMTPRLSWLRMFKIQRAEKPHIVLRSVGGFPRRVNHEDIKLAERSET